MSSRRLKRSSLAETKKEPKQNVNRLKRKSDEAFYCEPTASSYQKKNPLKTSVQENRLTPEKTTKRLKPSQSFSEDYENVQIQTSVELTPCSLIADPVPSFQPPSFLPENIPLPRFDWADSTEVWKMMQNAEDYYHRDAAMFSRHPSLQPVMRAMLLDWLNEVCQAYTLSRQTYYLALDFFDRYLSTKRDISKKRLQLLGITCLFIASKIEEIFPPKLDRFSFVCDGACDDKEILAKEQLVLNSLNWELSPLTPNSWLLVYMQVYSTSILNNKPCDKENAPDLSSGERFLFPNFESKLFVQIAHLIDLCTLNAGSLAFPYSVIAASAFYHFTNEDVVLQCTGKTMDEMSACIEWMIPFAIAIKNDGLEFVDKLLEDADKSITIQCHTINLDLLKSAQSIQAEIESNKMAPLDSSDTGVETGTSTLTPSKFPPTPPRS